MSARNAAYLRIGLLLALALGVWHLVRTRQNGIAHAQHAAAGSTQPAIDRAAKIYRDLYPEAASVRVEMTGSADTQWLLECQDSASASPAHFIWDVANGELVFCGALRLPDSDMDALKADLAIADQPLRAERMARRWLRHLGFADDGRKQNLSYLAKQWPLSRVRFVSYTTATRQILMGLDSATGDLTSFYSHQHSPATGQGQPAAPGASGNP